jgi:hypothetical protein
VKKKSSTTYKQVEILQFSYKIQVGMESSQLSGILQRDPLHASGTKELDAEKATAYLGQGGSENMFSMLGSSHERMQWVKYSLVTTLA